MRSSGLAYESAVSCRAEFNWVFCCICRKKWATPLCCTSLSLTRWTPSWRPEEAPGEPPYYSVFALVSKYDVLFVYLYMCVFRDSTGVADSIVNQLLSKIDGVDSLNNILIIGMTNRYAPFKVQSSFSSLELTITLTCYFSVWFIQERYDRRGRAPSGPSRAARGNRLARRGGASPGEPNDMLCWCFLVDIYALLTWIPIVQIINIHTAQMRKNHRITQEALDNLPELATLTKNYTGTQKMTEWTKQIWFFMYWYVLLYCVGILLSRRRGDWGISQECHLFCVRAQHKPSRCNQLLNIALIILSVKITADVYFFFHSWKAQSQKTLESSGLISWKLLLRSFIIMSSFWWNNSALILLFLNFILVRSRLRKQRPNGTEGALSSRNHILRRRFRGIAKLRSASRQPDQTVRPNPSALCAARGILLMQLYI